MVCECRASPSGFDVSKAFAACDPDGVAMMMPKASEKREMKEAKDRAGFSNRMGRVMKGAIMDGMEGLKAV